MTDDLPLFGKRRKSITERFEEWRTAHPEAVELLRKLALEALAKGRKKLGIAALVERARWDIDLHAPENGHKWNNDLRAPLSRWLMETTPQLRDVFETRERHTA